MRLATLVAATLLIAVSGFSQSSPSICPIKDFKGKTSEFGKRTQPVFKSERQHDGIDFYVLEGTPVLSTADGQVTRAETIQGYGMVVRVKHAKHLETFYAHLSKLAVKVRQTVKRGETIAYTGNSGLSSGPHLHYEVVENGVSVNPRKFIASK